MDLNQTTMEDIHTYPIYSVAVDPKFCPQCGTELGKKEVNQGEYLWCETCEMIFARNPLAAVHVVIKDGNKVLLLDEPIPQHEGLWSLPGGHASYDETPEEAVLRELYEETGLKAKPEDLDLLTVIHAQSPKTAYHFITYMLDYTETEGKLISEGDGFEILFKPFESVMSSDRIRKSDRDRIALAFQS